HGDGGDAGRRQPGQVAEHTAAGDEDLGLRGQVGTARLDQVDQRQAVGPGDLTGPLGLLQRVRVDRAAAYRRIVGDDHTGDVLDNADAGDHARADRVLGAPGREGGQLQERRVPVEQQLDAFAGEQLATGVMAGDVPVPAAFCRLRQRLVQLVKTLE